MLHGVSERDWMLNERLRARDVGSEGLSGRIPTTATIAAGCNRSWYGLGVNRGHYW